MELYATIDDGCEILEDRHVRVHLLVHEPELMVDIRNSHNHYGRQMYSDSLIAHKRLVVALDISNIGLFPTTISQLEGKLAHVPVFVLAL